LFNVPPKAVSFKQYGSRKEHLKKQLINFFQLLANSWVTRFTKVFRLRRASTPNSIRLFRATYCRYAKTIGQGAVYTVILPSKI
ncbi:hypothetical protein OAB93_00635, partial [bacterium]|nr:hypothetical protein [bacterium]